ncbi:MAG: EAL domain-containing protein [Hyphomicrobiaceae bacterium]
MSFFNGVKDLLQRNPLSSRMPVIGFGTALIATVWIAIVLQVTSERRAMWHSLAHETSNLALVFEQSAERTASEIDRIIKYLRASYERNGFKADWAKLVQEEFTFNKETVQIAVIDRDGMMITSSKMLYPEKPVDLSDREHYKVHAAANVDRLFISKPLLGRASNKWSVQFTRPFRNPDGTFAGVLVVSLDPDFLTRFYSTLNLGAGGGLALVGADGLVRAGAGIYSQSLGKALRVDATAGERLQAVGNVEVQTREADDGLQVTAVVKGATMPLSALITRSHLPQHRVWVNNRRTYQFVGAAITVVVLAAMMSSMLRRRVYERQLNYLARYDALTKLPNRTEFSALLESSLAKRRDGKRISIHLVDLDDFKTVNDTHGHPIGDALLVAVARRLSRTVGRDDCVARLGGDEFAVIEIGGSDAAAPSILANEICRELARPFDIEGVRLQSGASIGSVTADSKINCEDDLMRSADLALYAAKNAGGSTVRQFEERMTEEARERRAIETGLRDALEHEHLELHYQPILDITTMEVTGFEALVRWRHPQKGLIPPLSFIPVAEQTGLIVEIGAWVLHKACAEMANKAPGFKIAVNVSAIEFRDSDVAASVRSALDKSGLAPKLLEIEITESLLMKKDQSTLDQLDEIRKLGVMISMDDFGTGYSSLSYLQSYPIDCIKIDQSFVRAIGRLDNSRAIIKAIATLASSLNMTTIAEGVETEAQLATLETIGCAEAQGYLFSPPRPIDAILEWMNERSAERHAASLKACGHCDDQKAGIKTAAAA